MSLTAQQKRDKEARIQARKEIRDQKKKEIREEKRLNNAKDSLRQRWEENGWNISEKLTQNKDGSCEYHFNAARKNEDDTAQYIDIDGALLENRKIDVILYFSFYQNGRHFPMVMRQPEIGLAYEQYRRTQKMLEEKYAELSKTTNEEVERVEHIISKVEDPEYRHGKHKKYHKELLRELNKTLDTTKKQANDRTNNINNSKNKKSKKDNKKEQNGIEKS